MSRNIEPETSVGFHLTVQDVEERLEGNLFSPNMDESDNHFICDYCSKGVPKYKEPRVAQYLADNVLNENHPKTSQIRRDRPIIQLGTYCEECSFNRLFFPCIGFNEVRVMINVSEDWEMSDVEVTDVSPIDDGIRWDPKEVSKAITKIEFEKNILVAASELWGPENIFTVYDAAIDSVDMGELIAYDGSLKPKELGRARKEYEQFSQKMRKQGHSRKSFSKHVRNK